MKSPGIKRLLRGGLLAVAAALALPGCASSKPGSTAAVCRQCETKWVAVRTSSPSTDASPALRLGSAVSPVGDAPGEHDLERSRGWVWQREHFCCVANSADACAVPVVGKTARCSCRECQLDGAACCRLTPNPPLNVAASLPR